MRDKEYYVRIIGVTLKNRGSQSIFDVVQIDSMAEECSKLGIGEAIDFLSKRIKYAELKGRRKSR